eukprot:8077716-Pyramimonas_sp.AAC.1
MDVFLGQAAEAVQKEGLDDLHAQCVAVGQGASQQVRRGRQGSWFFCEIGFCFCGQAPHSLRRRPLQPPVRPHRRPLRRRSAGWRWWRPWPA